MKAGEIEPLDGLYKNAFNLVIGAQGRGKTYHANELIAKNAKYFDEVKKYAPGGSAGESDGDVHDLIEFLRDRVDKAKTAKADAKDAQILMTAIETSDPSFAMKRGVNHSRVVQLMDMYPNFKSVGKLPEALVLVDDMGGDPAINRAEAVFNDVSRRLRHLRLTILFNAHQYKDLVPFVRANTQILYLHGGLPKRDLQKILEERRVPGAKDIRDFERQYISLTEGFGWYPIDFYGKQKGDLQYHEKEENSDA